MSAPVVFEVEVDNYAATVEVDSPQVDVAPTDPTVVFGVTPGPRGNRGPAGDGAQVFGETPAGDVDGVNVVYTLANAYQASSTAVYLNGLRQMSGVCYLESGPVQITLDEPPLPGDHVSVDYLVQ